jgi:branched-chain amino acid transport system substrate-binding protein
MSTNPETTAGRRFVFRVPYLDTFQGRVLARFAREDLKVSRAAILYDIAGDYNKTLAEVFARTFEENGGKVVAVQTYTSDRNTEFTAQLSRIKTADPDVLFLPNFAHDARLQAVRARSLGIASVLLGGDGWDTSGFSAEAVFDGSFASRQWQPGLPGEKTRAFVSSYESTFGVPPEDVAATTYDSFGILFAAMEKAQSVEADAVRTALLGLRGYDGVTGTISYQENGDPVKSAVIVRLHAGTETVYFVVQP